MGIFDFFKKQPHREQKEEVKEINSMPTVKPDKGMFTSFDEAYFNEMKNIEGLTSKEINEIHNIIISSDGGFLNMGAYHERIFNDYFSGKLWTWKEYEFWDKKFNELGRFPHNWIRGKPQEITPYDVFSPLKVSELKEFLTSNNVAIPPKTKKEDLLNLVESIPHLDKFPIWQKAEAKRETRDGYGLYAQLMLHINFKAKSLHSKNSRKELGITQEKLMIVFKEHSEFIDIALKRDKKAIPPFFPTDMTITRAIIPGFED